MQRIHEGVVGGKYFLGSHLDDLHYSWALNYVKEQAKPHGDKVLCAIFMCHVYLQTRWSLHLVISNRELPTILLESILLILQCFFIPKHLPDNVLLKDTDLFCQETKFTTPLGSCSKQLSIYQKWFRLMLSLPWLAKLLLMFASNWKGMQSKMSRPNQPILPTTFSALITTRSMCLKVLSANYFTIYCFHITLYWAIMETF